MIGNDNVVKTNSRRFLRTKCLEKCNSEYVALSEGQEQELVTRIPVQEMAPIIIYHYQGRDYKDMHRRYKDMHVVCAMIRSIIPKLITA